MDDHSHTSFNLIGILLLSTFIFSCVLQIPKNPLENPYFKLFALFVMLPLGLLSYYFKLPQVLVIVMSLYVMLAMMHDIQKANMKT